MTKTRLIRQLTEVERKFAQKYFAQLAAAKTEVARTETILRDAALAFAGREAPVTMTEDGLFEQYEDAIPESGAAQ